jgi:hypothetical protein
VEKSDPGPDLKGAGYGHLNRSPPYGVFPAAAVIKSTSPDRAAPLAAADLLVVCVKLHPVGWVCSTSRPLVDVERAPFHCAAYRLSAASSNTSVTPLFQRYPSRQKVSQRHRPRFLIGRVSLSMQSRKHCIGRAKRWILVLEYGYYDFQNPPYMASRQSNGYQLLSHLEHLRAKIGTGPGRPYTPIDTPICNVTFFCKLRLFDCCDRTQLQLALGCAHIGGKSTYAISCASPTTPPPSVAYPSYLRDCRISICIAAVCARHSCACLKESPARMRAQ